LTDIKTDEALLKALEAAARKQPSASEIEKQRVSFIMGSLSDKNTVTRARVTQILAAHEGRNAA
jgi:hypothetical protein